MVAVERDRGYSVVRPLGWSDLLTLRRMQPKGTTLDVRRTTFATASPLVVGALGLVLHQPIGATTLVDKVDGEVGIAQASPQHSGKTWDVRFLAPSIAHSPAAARIWQRLLGALGILACQHGAERLLAYVPEDAFTEDTFRGAGFEIVAREQVFVLTAPTSPAPEPTGFRKLAARDHQELRTLVTAAVPSRVSGMGEATPTRDRAPKGFLASAPKEYIWVRDSNVGAYVGVFTGPACYWLEILVRPDLRAEIAPHLRYALSTIDCSPQSPVFCAIADHVAGTGWILRALGFEPYARQALMSSRLVSRVQVRASVVFPGLESSIDTSAPCALAPKNCAGSTSTESVFVG